jgi:amino acid permease
MYHDDNIPELRQSFGNRNDAFSLAVLPLVCMLYEAFVMHYNSARFYTELKRASLPRFAGAVSSAFGFSSVVYVAIACFGFLTFGGNSSNYILNNYSPFDPLANLSRMAVFISTITTYPIVFIGCRDGVLDILDVPTERQTSRNLDMLTVVMLLFLTIIAIFVTDLGLINAVGGGSLATIIVFVVPTIMYWILAHEPRGKDEIKDLPLAIALCLFGILLGIVGLFIAIQ